MILSMSQCSSAKKAIFRPIYSLWRSLNEEIHTYNAQSADGNVDFSELWTDSRFLALMCIYSRFELEDGIWEDVGGMRRKGGGKGGREKGEIDDLSIPVAERTVRIPLLLFPFLLIVSCFPSSPFLFVQKSFTIFVV